MNMVITQTKKRALASLVLQAYFHTDQLPGAAKPRPPEDTHLGELTITTLAQLEHPHLRVPGPANSVLLEPIRPSEEKNNAMTVIQGRSHQKVRVPASLALVAPSLETDLRAALPVRQVPTPMETTILRPAL